MSTVLELMEKRKKAWETAKAFLDSRRGSDGLISAEDNATYERMEADVVALGKEIERLQRQAAIDAELAKATSEPIKDKPGMKPGIRGADVHLLNTRLHSGMRCVRRTITMSIMHFPSGKMPRAVIWCRMSLKENWWKDWKRRVSSVPLQP